MEGQLGKSLHGALYHIWAASLYKNLMEEKNDNCT